MGRKKSVVDHDLWLAFRNIIDRARSQYGITIADMCDVPPRKQTATDVYAERVGIQKKARNRIRAAGYNTPAKLHKLIENALFRPTEDWKVHAILFMACNCRATIKWRQAHSRAEDVWLGEFFAFLKLLPPGVGFDPPEPRNGKAVAFFHPGGASDVANDLVDELTRLKYVKRVDAARVSQALAAKMRDDAELYLEAFVNWLGISDLFVDVVVREGTRPSQPEGVRVLVKQIVVEPRTARSPNRELAEGERVPTRSEYLRGIAEFAIKNWGKSGPRRPLIIERNSLEAFHMVAEGSTDEEAGTE